ncbi:MAG: hypothetical protein OEZ68_05055 [Gammaproteobacteria bacterium]|nr:hypothetical protein [Gammaproteobacteria bacterium]MDH5800157.1 hypothetical protein [Gammaproteobacteria bacterium]
MKKLLPIALSFAFVSSPCFAGKSTIDLAANLGLMDQALFQDLVEELGAALSYKAVAPAESMGLLGIDVAIEFSQTEMGTQGLKRATGNQFGTNLYLAKVHAHKGLPFGLDVGASLTKDPSGNVQNMGAELRFELLEGGTLMPALGLRGTYSVLSGVDHLDLSSMGLEIAISKGFLMATPFAGVGKVRITGDSDLFAKETVDLTKVFVGLNFNMGLFNLAAEIDKTGENTTSTAKFGFRF